MRQIDFESFVKWQQAGKRRYVKIELGGHTSGSKDAVYIWVYDYDLMAGQLCFKSADEIDLRRKALEQLEREVQRLKELVGQ